MRSQLLRVPDVAKVEVFGAQPEKIFVEISQKKLAQLGLDFNQVLSQIAAQNAVEGAGTLNAGAQNLQVRVPGAFQSVDDLRALPIRAVNVTTGQASSLRLGDLADIRRATADPPQVKVRHQGKPVIALGVAMAKGGDIIALGQALRARVDAIQAELPLGVTLERVQDQPAAVSRSVGEFVKVLIEAVAVVLAVSFISLGLHFRPFRIDIWPGLVVGITIPLVLSITFVTMYYWGVGLHKISLGSLIIALGLLVDDAIIAVEMMVRKLEEGFDKKTAATYAYDATSMPMLTGTLITAAGFLPIGMAKSVTGEYTFAIFAVTSAALVISWLVSVYFVPYLGAWLLHTRKQVEGESHENELFNTPFYNAFRRTVHWCVRHRWVTIGLTLATFALGIAGMGKVQQQFFPDSSRPEILVDLWLPEGSTIQETEVLARRFEGPADEGAGGRHGHHLDRQRRAALLPAAGPDLPAAQCVAGHPAGARPARARGLAQAPAGAACRGISRGTRSRQAAAQRAARALSGAVPRGRAGCLAGACLGRRGQGGAARQPQHARRERQLERIDQGAQAADRPGQGARAGRDQPVDCAGLAHHPVGHHDRPVPRGRQAGRHRASAAGGGAQRHHRPRQTPTCPPPAVARSR